MRIAVNTRFLLSDYLEGYGRFLDETLKRITRDHPEHDFLFIFDRPFDQRFIYGPNVQGIVQGPRARHPLLWKWWYNFAVPGVLKKYRAQIFLSPDGFCSLTTKLPQCLVVHDLAFLHVPDSLPPSQLRYYRRNTPRFLEQARVIVTVSEFSKRDICSQYPVDPGRVFVIPNAARENFGPVTAGVKQEVKEKYTAGHEYFLYTGSIHPRKNLINLLRAFSVFKKMQRSSFRLVLAGRLAWKYESFLEALKSYKYRQDVLLTGYLGENELARLMASAYAVVYPSLFEGFGLPVIEAMRAGVPVITSSGTAMQELANGAALLADPRDPGKIAEQLMRIYKDEDLRSRLIEKGAGVAAQYSWERSAALLWSSLEKTLAAT
ncbi:MAG TPA: glycosyltransferase family 1 protein [Chitinophagaceae bacterium]|nr:glycosyltransferase family 1 protein [Chitinophagaceae bacterium]